jgi:hypothetical protein
VRLTDLPRTTSFRLALMFLLLFGGASLLLFGFLYRETNGYLMGMADDWLHREQEGFAQLDQQAYSNGSERTPSRIRDRSGRLSCSMRPANGSPATR